MTFVLALILCNVTINDETYAQTDVVAQIDDTEYTDILSALNASEPGDIISLIHDVNLDGQPALVIKDKGTEDNPITIDLKGFSISGNNSQTSTSSTADNSKKTGVLWIEGSHVILTDSSTGDKGKISNSATGGVNTIHICASPDSGKTTSLLINNGVELTGTGNSNSKVVNIYSANNNHGDVNVVIDNAKMSSSGRIIQTSDRENISLCINGGYYSSTLTSSTTSRISNHELVSITGGTFENCNFGVTHVQRLIDGKVAVYNEINGNQVVVVQDTPSEYTAHLKNDTYQYYDRIYLSSESTNLAVLENMIMNKTAVEVLKDATLNLEEFGTAQGIPDELTLDLADGVTLSGNITLSVATVTVVGNGTFAETFDWSSSDSAIYEVSYDSDDRAYTGRIIESAIVCELTYADGTKVDYLNISNANTGASRNPGSVMKLLQDIKCNTLTISADVSIDLNGHTWSVDSTNRSYINVTSGADVRFINTNADKDGSLEGATDTFCLINISGGKVTIDEGVKFVGGTVLLSNGEGGELTVRGTIDTTNTDSTPIMGNGNGDSDNTVINIEDGAVIKADQTAAIYHPQNGTLNITGGEITGFDGIYMKSGTLNMTGGSVTATGSKSEYEGVEGGYSLLGNAITLEACDYPGGAPSADISGGTVTSQNNKSVACYVKEGSTDISDKQFITGGTFISGGSIDTSVEDYTDPSFTMGEDGTVNPDPAKYVATVGDDYFSTLQSALDYITDPTTPSGDYLVLICAEIDEPIQIYQVANKNVTIDGQGNTISANIDIDGNARFDGAETLTFQNINFNVSAGEDAITSEDTTAGSYDYAHNVTITGCTFELASDSTAVGLRLYQSFNVLIEDCTFTGGHSMGQFKAINGLKIQDVTVESSRGVALGTSYGVEIINTKISAQEYGIRGDDSTHDADVTIADTYVNAAQPIVIRYVTGDNTGGYELNVSDSSLVLVDGSPYGTITVTGGEDMTDVVEPTQNDVIITETRNGHEAEITNDDMFVTIPSDRNHVSSDGGYDNITVTGSDPDSGATASVTGSVDEGLVQLVVSKVETPHQQGSGTVGILLEFGNISNPIASVSLTFAPDEGMVLSGCTVYYYTQNGESGTIDDVVISGNVVSFVTSHCTEYDFVPTFTADTEEPTIDPEPDFPPYPVWDDDDDYVPPIVPTQPDQTSGDDTTTTIACAAAAVVAALIAVFLIMEYRKN